MAVWSEIALSNLGTPSRIEAEYYKPEFLEVANKLSAVLAAPISRYLRYLTDGTHITPRYIKNGVPFLSSSDIDPFLISFKINKFISEKEHNKLLHCQPAPGDILMSKSGRTGSCAVVPNNIKKGDWNIYEGIALLRVDGIDPYYLEAFLNSKYGYFQINRELKGVAQPHLHLEDILRLRVYMPDMSELSFIREIVIKGTGLAKKAHKLYQQAQRLFESELGLDKLKFKKPLSYTGRFSTVRLSDAFNAGRVDAQCFNPDAVFYEDWLRIHNKCDNLYHLLDSMIKGKIHKETRNGQVSYCSIKHISENELTCASKCMPPSDLPLANVNDLLIAITGATIGKVGIVKRYNELAFSGDLLCLKISSGIDPHYLLVALGHATGQIQLNRWVTGSTNGHLAPRDVGRVLVPRLEKRIELRIAGLAEESLKVRLESEKLFDQAQAQVERLVEEASKK